jgi:hypothetical protein
MGPLQRWVRLAVFWSTTVLAGAASAPAADCPSRARFEPTAPSAILDAGWSGIAHDEPIFGTVLDVAVSCGPTTPPCGTCTITGAFSDPAEHRLRCSNDTSLECTAATEVADCGGPDTCREFLSVPQPLNAGGLPLCFMTTLDGAVSGTVDVESGAFAPVVPIRATVYNGVFVPPFPGGPNVGCPRCVGDPVANDGARDGTCDDGARTALACDAQATSPYSDFGSVSFDCPPSGSPVAQFVNVLPFSTTPHSVTLTPASTLCTGAPPALRCFCSTCNHAPDPSAGYQTCFTDADCPPSGGNPGICGGKRCLSGPNDGAPCAVTSECPGGGICGRVGEPTKPNACFEDTLTIGNCNPDVDGEGICTAGPVDTRCGNHPNRGCVTDDDCDGVPGSCEAVPRACFLDNGLVGGSVTVDGVASAPVAGVAAPTDIGAFACLGPTTDPYINVWGLPGLGRIHQPGRLTLGNATPVPTPTSPATPVPTVTAAAGICPAAPDACRAPTVPSKASLRLLDRTPDAKDQLAWRWLAGAATTVAELGDPLGADDYALCLYDGTGLRAVFRMPAGGTCAGKPCWKSKTTGFLYRNKDATPNGITQLTLKAGVDGKAQVQAKGKGVALPMPALPSLVSTLHIQVRNATSGLCFDTQHVPPFDKSTPERLQDRGD